MHQINNLNLEQKVRLKYSKLVESRGTYNTNSQIK